MRKNKKYAMGGQAIGDLVKGGIGILEAVLNDPSKGYTNQPLYNASTMRGMTNPYQHMAMGGEVGDDIVPPKGYKASTLKQRQDWNAFLDYMGEAGLQGNTDLDKRDQTLWIDNFKKFKKANPKLSIDESFVPIAQYEGALLRGGSEIPGVASRGVVDNFAKTLGDPWKKNVSPIDSWVGSVTSQMYYPQHRGGTNVPTFGLDYDAYNQYILSAGANTAKFAMGGKAGNYIRAMGGMPGMTPVEVEGGEVLETPSGQIAKVSGPSHESGGVDLVVDNGTKVFSDRLTVDGKTMQQRKLFRERRMKKLKGLLQDSPKDTLLRNTLKRTEAIFNTEEDNDMRLQEVANSMYNAPKGKYENGGIIRPIPYYSVTATPPTTEGVNIGAPMHLDKLNWNNLNIPESNIPNTQHMAGEMTTGDYVGLAGTAFNAIAPMINTIKNAQNSKPNINRFKGFGKDALDANTASQEHVDTQRQAIENDINSGANTQRASARSDASGINTVRALDTITEMGRNKAINEASNTFSRQMMSLLGERAQLENVQDQVVMSGEAKRDMEDKADIDNFYSNFGRDLVGFGEGVQSVGRNLNISNQNKVDARLLSQLSQYGLGFDAQGNLISTRR